jgi:hypothetical protein
MNRNTSILVKTSPKHIRRPDKCHNKRWNELVYLNTSVRVDKSISLEH